MSILGLEYNYPTYDVNWHIRIYRFRLANVYRVITWARKKDNFKRVLHFAAQVSSHPKVL